MARDSPSCCSRSSARSRRRLREAAAESRFRILRWWCGSAVGVALGVKEGSGEEVPEKLAGLKVAAEADHSRESSGEEQPDKSEHKNSSIKLPTRASRFLRSSMRLCLFSLDSAAVKYGSGRGRTSAGPCRMGVFEEVSI